MVDTNNTDHAQEVLKRKREALHVLEEKIALYTPAEVPGNLEVQRKVLQDEIAKLEAQRKTTPRAKKRKQRPKTPPGQTPEVEEEVGENDTMGEQSPEMGQGIQGTWDKYRTQIIVAVITALAVVLAAVCGLFPGAVTEITKYLLNRPTSVAAASPTVEETTPLPVLTSTYTPTSSSVPGPPPTHVRPPTATITPTATSTFTPEPTAIPIPPTNTPMPTFAPIPQITLIEPPNDSTQRWKVVLRWQFRKLESNECFSVRAWPHALGKENIREEDRCFHIQTPELQYNGGLGDCSGKIWWEVVYVPVSCDVARNYTGAITITSEPEWFFYEPPPPQQPTTEPTKPEPTP